MYHFLFKRFLMVFIFFGFANATQGDSTLLHSTTEENPANNAASAVDFLPDPNTHFGHWVATRSNTRLVRSLENGGSRRSCDTMAYHVDSQVGKQANCPFDWMENYEARRIPRRIVEQVCRSCRACGYNQHCVQLKVRTEVFFRDTGEYGHQFVRSGCVCMPQEVGSTANPYDVEI